MNALKQYFVGWALGLAACGAVCMLASLPWWLWAPFCLLGSVVGSVGVRFAFILLDLKGVGERLGRRKAKERQRERATLEEYKKTVGEVSAERLQSSRQAD